MTRRKKILPDVEAPETKLDNEDIPFSDFLEKLEELEDIIEDVLPVTPTPVDVAVEEPSAGVKVDAPPVDAAVEEPCVDAEVGAPPAGAAIEEPPVGAEVEPEEIVRVAPLATRKTHRKRPKNQLKFVR